MLTLHGLLQQRTIQASLFNIGPRLPLITTNLQAHMCFMMMLQSR